MSRSINQIPHAHAGGSGQSGHRGRSARAGAAQNAYGTSLPNFRNLGIVLRILLGVHVAVLFTVALKSPSLYTMGDQLMEAIALVEPLLILSLVLLYALNGVLSRARYFTGAVAVMLLVLALTTLLYLLTRSHLPMDLSGITRYWLLVGLVTAILLYGFELRGRALSPAISEARLQALQARIRPHFLFNSINAVLSLIRQEPRRAETALEDMAELFRVLMADNRELTPLSREIELCRQYLGLEQLRLGKRLQVDWHTGNIPADAMIPPLVLQPLLENAVYHGIEPRTKPGIISINVYASRDQVHAVLRNPYAPASDYHVGNKMALANIRERLQLHYDAEASLTARAAGDVYEVHIVIPYQKEATA